VNQLLAIGAGGAVGSILRYVIGMSVQRLAGTGFPLGTVIVNILGSFAIGLLYVWLIERMGAPHTLRLFLIVGVLGGFTTFSSFSLETVTLLMESRYGYALLNVAASVLLCLAGTRLGVTLARLY
jgi:CrcB protein